MVQRNSTLTKRKLVGGWGVNDLSKPVKRDAYIDDEGVYHKRWAYPLYEHWKNIIARARCPKYHAKFPAYSDVEVCEDWKYLSKFEEWALTHDYEGKALDKDILGDGKLYSPDTCCFITPRLNGFLVGCRIKKDLPLGVTWEQDRQKYKAEIAINGKSRRLGNFTNQWQAHLVYCKKKLELAQQILVEEQADERISSALQIKLQKQVDNAEMLYLESLKEKQ